MADESPNHHEADAATAPGDDLLRFAPQPSRTDPTDTINPTDDPSRPVEPIDMSAFEVQFAAAQHGLPLQRQPGVEWAVEWADGRLTRVHSEAAARFVADRHSGCQVVCRIVGPWGQA